MSLEQDRAALEDNIKHESATQRHCQFNIEQWSRLIDEINQKIKKRDLAIDNAADLTVAVEGLKRIEGLVYLDSDRSEPKKIAEATLKDMRCMHNG